MMNSRPCVLLAVCMLFCLVSVTGCLTSSDGDGDKDSDGSNSRTKTLSFPASSLKLIEDYQADLGVTIDPPASGDQWILWSFAWPESTVSFHTSAVKQPTLNAWPLKEGDLTLIATLYDSLEYKVLGELAPSYGSASINISVRKISVDITSEQGSSYLEYTFTASTPHQDYLLPTINYEWDFGDNRKLEQKNAQTTTHIYEESGTYIVSVKLSAVLEKGNERWIQIASDTDTVLIQRPVTEDLELVITPSDTVWNTVTSINLKAEPSLDRIDYPEQVRWVIDYGDGESSEDTGYLYDTTIYHRYSETGTYILTMTIYNHATGDLLAQDSATITINNLPFLQKTNYIYAFVKGFNTKHYGTYDVNGTYTETSDMDSFWGFGSSGYDLAWNGQNFVSEYTSGSDTQTTVSRFEGTVSSDGTMLERLEYSVTTNDSDYQDKGDVLTRVERIVLSDVPLDTSSIYYHRFFEESSNIGQYVTEFEWWSKNEHTDGTAGYSYYGDYEWQNTSLGVPQLTMEFKQQ